MKNLFASAARRTRVQGSRMAGLLLVLGSAVFTAAGCVSTTDDASSDGANNNDQQVNSCAVGQTACDGWCVDLSNNATSCGACGNSCNPGSSCAAGACQCQVGLSQCTTGCADVNSDGLNCGACGTQCAAGTVCSLGACSATCAAGLTQCGASCIDPMNDFLNCGTCGNVCGSGTQCVAGACQCPAGQTCDQGTPVTGTGGTSAGTGGTSAGTGGTTAGSGGTTAGTGGTSSGIEGGGYVTAFDWKGYAFTSAFGDATISPDDFGDVTGFPLCASGRVPTSEVGEHGAMIGWSINQGQEDGDPALAIAPTLDGIAYNIDNSSTAELRIQIQGPDGATDANDRWCANIGGGGEGVVPWDQFNTECWLGGDGVDYAMQDISQVLVLVPAQGSGDVNFDFCVNGLAPSDVDGNQGGEGCDLDSNPAGNHLTGTMTLMEGGIQRRLAIDQGPVDYAIQNNAFNPSGGMNFSVSYDGNSFSIDQQTGSTGTNFPLAYPSLFIGSAGGDGMATDGSNLARRVGDLTNIPTALRWTQPSGGRYNVAYDVWFAPGPGDNGPGNRSFLMVWFHHTADVAAEGQPSRPGRTFNVNGVNFIPYIWTQGEGRPIISYVAQGGPLLEWSFDLNDFINDAKTQTRTDANGGAPVITDDLYLTNVFAGTEIWNGTQGLSVDNFCIEVE